MTSIPPTIAAEQALTRQAVALSTVKAAAEQQQQLANIIAESARTVVASGSRGGNVNTSA